MADLEFLCIGQSLFLDASSKRGSDWVEKNINYRNRTGGKTVISMCHFDEVKSAALENHLTIGIVEQD